jgi:hypothetical protein
MAGAFFGFIWYRGLVDRLQLVYDQYYVKKIAKLFTVSQSYFQLTQPSLLRKEGLKAFCFLNFGF